jgi:hypothetical protein
MPRAVLPAKDFAHRHLFLLWTDALCFREMAKQAPEKYLQSMCIRNAVLSAWTSLEMACSDALGVKRLRGEIKGSFIERLSRELVRRGKGSLNLDSGVWHDLNETVRCNRNIFAHSGVESAEKSFPPFSIAEDAIKWIRIAIQDIYARTGKDCPRWVNADHVGGWPERGGVRSTLTVGDVGANLNSPGVIKLILVREDGKEDLYRYFSPDTPDAVLGTWVEDLLGGEKFNLSYAKIRVYHGSICGPRIRSAIASPRESMLPMNRCAY